MFNTIGSFSAVYFTLAAILFILVLFEKHFIHLEDRIRANRANLKKSVKKANTRKNVQKSNPVAVRSSNTKSTTTIRRLPDNAA